MNHLSEVIQRCAQKGILIDTNLLVLLFVGSYNRELISSHKRTRAYTESDFDILLQLLKRFKNRIYATPNILTEVNNLTSNIQDEKFCAIFAKMVNMMNEEYVQSNIAVEKICFPRLGLTDSSIFAIGERCLVLTDDFDLYMFLVQNKCDVINFNHIRQYYLEDYPY